MSRPELMKQLIGVKAVDPELPADQRKIVAVTTLIFAEMKSFRASQDKRQSDVNPALGLLDTASSFASFTAMQKCIDAVNEQFSIDRTTSQALQDWPLKVKAQLDQTDLTENQKENYVDGFKRSLAASDYLAARQKMLDAEARWAASTIGLYQFAEEHAKNIRVAGGHVAIADDAVRSSFNSNLENAEQLRTAFIDQAEAANGIRTANIKRSGLNENDLK